MKIPFKHRRAAERGMEEGATFAAIGAIEDHDRAAIRCGFILQKERAVFCACYLLARSYIEPWRQGAAGSDLVRLAAARGDLVLLGWHYAWSLNGYFAEEL